MRHLTTNEPTRLDRRHFIAGAAAAGLVAACGGGDSDTISDSGSNASSDETTSPDTEPVADSADLEAGTYSLIQRFIPNALVAGAVRVPFTLSIGVDFVNDGPEVLGAELFDLDGNAISQLTAARRDVTPAAYYAFTAQLDAGIYTLVVDGGPAEGANFQVFEPSKVAVPGPGEPLPAFGTPTTADPAGVDPICTRQPNCEFHSVTLAEALASDKPVAYFVGTPAFCQTGSCTPALEALIAVGDDYADRFEIVHAEVWTDLTATEIAPAVTELAMNFEPALFITDAGGMIVERVDGLWDETELRERLDAALAS